MALPGGAVSVAFGCTDDGEAVIGRNYDQVRAFHTIPDQENEEEYEVEGEEAQALQPVGAGGADNANPSGLCSVGGAAPDGAATGHNADGCGL